MLLLLSLLLVLRKCLLFAFLERLLPMAPLHSDQAPAQASNPFSHVFDYTLTADSSSVEPVVMPQLLVQICSVQHLFVELFFFFGHLALSFFALEPSMFWCGFLLLKWGILDPTCQISIGFEHFCLKSFKVILKPSRACVELCIWPALIVFIQWLVKLLSLLRFLMVSCGTLVKNFFVFHF